MTGRAGAAAALAAWLVSWSSAAFAYRPFDGTDAAVAGPGELEVELGPVGYLREGSDHRLIAPALVLNYGFARNWEAVLQGAAAHGLSAESRGESLVGNGAFLQGVLREGSLQDKPGPSIATEFGVLLPGVADEPGTGGLIGLIASQRWPLVTVHLNVFASLTRQQHGDLFLDAIVEGPYEWPVRPAAEVFRERDFGQSTTTSFLIGAIWQPRENLAFDAAVRRARVDGRTIDELRLGVTFSFPVR